MASLADMIRQNKMQSIPQDKLLGGLSSGLGAVRNFGNKVNVPYFGGMGDMFLGKSPEEIENWSYGNSPFQSTEMGLPQIKKERKQSLVDALSTLAGPVSGLAKATEGLPVGMSIKNVANKNLNAGLSERYLSTGKLSPKEMAEYEANGLAMETPQLQRYNVANAMANPERKAYKDTLNVPVYHGTNEDIYAMSVEGKGKTRGAGAFVGTNPIASETYVQAFQGGNILPLLLNDKGFLKVNGKGQYWNDISTDSLYHKKTPLTDILPLEKNDFTSTDELGSLAKDAEYKGITIKNLDDLGLNSHIFRAKEYLNNKYGIVPDETWSNVPENKFNEARNFMENQYKKQRSDVTAVNDPSLLRSRFAAFDPLRKNSSSLLASIMGGTALVGQYNKEKKMKEMR